MSALRSTFSLVRAMLPMSWACVEIGRANQHGALIRVEGEACYKLRRIGRGWAVTPYAGGQAEWYETRDDAIAAILSQVWDA